MTGAAGDLLLYRWATARHNGWLAGALSSWIVSLILFGLLLRWSGRTLGVTFVLAAVVHTAIILSWDAIKSGRRLSLLEWAGLALAMAGVLFIEWGQLSSEASN